MSKVVINYKVEKEEWTKAVDRAFATIIKKVKIDGFRPGKAPRNVYEKKYGCQDLYIEASDELIHHHFHEILDEKKINPIVEPKVDLIKLDDDGLEVNYTFIVDPEVKLGKYKGLKVKKDKVEATKEEIDHEIEHMKEQYAEMVSKDGKIEKGDTAIIDFEGFKDGVPFDGGKGENYSLEIGSNSFIPGFEDGLIGMSKDEEKDINLTFPKDYHAEDLKGQKVIFKVKVNDIKLRKIPELDKNFFLDLGLDGVTNKSELEAMIKEEIEARKEFEAENKFIDELLKEAVKDMKIELADEIVDVEIERMYNNFLQKMSMQGINEELYFEYTKSNKEDIQNKMRPEAIFRIKARYLLEAISKEENINITDEDVETEALALADKYHMTKEELSKEFGGLDMIKYDLQMRKAIEVLKDNN